jgi:hypothetical protein
MKTIPEDESFDIGSDTRSGVAMVEYRYDPPLKFNGKNDKLQTRTEQGGGEAIAASGQLWTESLA